MEIGAFRQRASGSTVLIGLVVQILLAAVLAAVLLVAHRMGHFWLVPTAFAILSGIAIWAYRTLLDPLSRFAQTRRETLAARLCR